MLNTIILSAILLISCMTSICLYNRNKPNNKVNFTGQEIGAAALLRQYHSVRWSDAPATEKREAMIKFNDAVDEYFRSGTLETKCSESNIANLETYRELKFNKGQEAKG